MEYREWANQEWIKCKNKITKTAERIQSNIPYTTEKGKYTFVSDIGWWTNSFWGGILWLMFEETRDERFKLWAEEVENTLNKNFENYDRLDHDVGFLWLLSSGKNYQLTKSEKSRNSIMLAANVLAGRYNSKGKFIRAWNNYGDESINGWAIIDCIMNIRLLYLASTLSGDNSFRYVANNHADTVLKHFIRPDGSVKHIVKFNCETGEYEESLAGQGYAVGSSWSRGQAWAINGLSQTYMATEDKRYLDAAKRVANYFITACVDDPVPRTDFRQPTDAISYDSSAGAIASSGLINIANCCVGAEKEMYLNAAARLLKALDERCCPWDDTNDEAILNYGTERFGSKHQALIYGDYYFLEAVLKLKNLC